MKVIITFCPRCYWWTVGPFAATILPRCENCRGRGYKAMMEELELPSLGALADWRRRHPQEAL